MEQLKLERDDARARLTKLTALVMESIDWAGRNGIAVYAKLLFAIADLADKKDK